MKKLLIVLSVIFLVVVGPKFLPQPLAIILNEVSANWPQWRGPQGQGISTEQGLPTEWSTTRNVMWKTPIAGRGHSSPIIWGDRIFLTTAVEGEVIPGAMPPKHRLGDADPLVGHGIVVASAAHPVKRALAIRLGGSGDVTDTPQVIWQRDKGTGYTRRFSMAIMST